MSCSACDNIFHLLISVLGYQELFLRPVIIYGNGLWTLTCVKVPDAKHICPPAHSGTIRTEESVMAQPSA